MEERKSDRRVVKTKRAIRNAFIKLLSLKDYNEITVKDIADYADVDRKTVYNYYRGVYEIRDEVENEIVEIWKDTENEYNIERLKDPKSSFELLTKILNEDIELYGNLMKAEANSQIARKMSGILKEKIYSALMTTTVRHGNEDYIATFLSSGLFSVYQMWFNSNREIPLEELSKQMATLVFNGLTDFSVQ